MLAVIKSSLSSISSCSHFIHSSARECWYKVQPVAAAGDVQHEKALWPGNYFLVSFENILQRQPQAKDMSAVSNKIKYD